MCDVLHQRLDSLDIFLTQNLVGVLICPILELSYLNPASCKEIGESLDEHFYFSWSKFIRIQRNRQTFRRLSINLAAILRSDYNIIVAFIKFSCLTLFDLKLFAYF